MYSWLIIIRLGENKIQLDIKSFISIQTIAHINERKNTFLSSKTMCKKYKVI